MSLIFLDDLGELFTYKETYIVKKYRKKPVVIEAVQFTTNNEPSGSPHMDRIVNWMNQGRDKPNGWHNGTDIFIYTLEGEMRASVGDWIIKGVKGEFYPCKSDVFDMTYEQEDLTPTVKLGVFE